MKEVGEVDAGQDAGQEVGQEAEQALEVKELHVVHIDWHEQPFERCFRMQDMHEYGI